MHYLFLLLTCTFITYYTKYQSVNQSMNQHLDMAEISVQAPLLKLLSLTLYWTDRPYITDSGS